MHMFKMFSNHFEISCRIEFVFNFTRRGTFLQDWNVFQARGKGHEFRKLSGTNH